MTVMIAGMARLIAAARRYLVHEQPEALAAIQARIVLAGVMFAVLPILIWRVAPVEQGFFFSFLNIAGLFLALDFGLLLSILQTANHLSRSSEREDLERFWNFAWPLSTATVLTTTLVIGAIGTAVFSAAGARTDWIEAWWIYLASTAAQQGSMVVVTFVEGAVSPLLAWRYHRNLELGSGIVLLVCLAAGAGIWSLPIYGAARCLQTLPFLLHHRCRLPRLARPASLAWWRARIWPFQWRIAISSLANALLLRAFTPMVLALQGPVTASRFGTSWAIMAMLIQVSTAWPLSQTARFSQLASEGRFAELRRRFHFVLWMSTAAVGLTVLLAMVAFGMLDRLAPALAGRFADPGTTGLLLAAAVAQHAVICYQPFLRATREDPLLRLMLFGSIATVLVCGLAAWAGSIRLVAAWYLACSLAGLPYCFWRDRQTGLPPAASRPRSPSPSISPGPDGQS